MSSKIMNISDKFIRKAEYIVYLCIYIHISCIY